LPAIYSFSLLDALPILPALLFLAILRADLSAALRPGLLIYFTLATVAGFLLAWGWALWRCPRADRGVYVQGAFRGNNGIVGLALDRKSTRLNSSHVKNP